MRITPLSARVLRLEPLWLLLLSPLALVPGKFLPLGWQWVAPAALLLFWPLRLLLTGSVTLRTPLRLPVAALLLPLPVAIVVAVDRTRAWEMAGYLLVCVAWTQALVHWPPARRRPVLIVWVLLLLAAGLALAGPLILTDTLRGTPLYRLQQRAAPLTSLLGDSMNPNTLANALLVAFPFALLLALRGGWAQNRWARPTMALLSLGLFGILLMTESRGAWLGLAVMLPLLVALRWPRFLWALPVVATAGVAALIRRPALLGGLEQRVEIWQRGLFILHAFPWTGGGLGQFAPIVAMQFPLVQIVPTVPIIDAHNLLLQVGADLGIPGLVAWLAIFLAQATMLVLVLRQHLDTLTWALAAGALASTIGGLAAGIFNSANWGVKVAILPWLVTALAVLLYEQLRQARPSGA